MKEIFKTGDKKSYKRVVTPEDEARFESGTVHHVYATFALARDAEWTCRLFVLEMKEAHEEGIGTFVSVEHISPALTGSEVTIEATVIKLNRNEIVCAFTAKVNDRLIATGEAGQKILSREKLDILFASLNK